MKYLGGKSRQAKKIAEFINKEINNKDYYEPFCGSAYVSLEINTTNKYVSDINKYLIAALQIQYPPNYIDELLYKDIKNNKEYYSDDLVGYVGFACSFGGKFFGGYARGNQRNYAKEASNWFIKNKEKLQKLNYSCQSYLDINPVNSIIYCDPPYFNTTKYSTKDFNHNEFWDKVEHWSKNNIVYVTEFTIPEKYSNNVIHVFKRNNNLDVKGSISQFEKLVRISYAN